MGSSAFATRLAIGHPYKCFKTTTLPIIGGRSDTRDPSVLAILVAVGYPTYAVRALNDGDRDRQPIDVTDWRHRYGFRRQQVASGDGAVTGDVDVTTN